MALKLNVYEPDTLFLRTDKEIFYSSACYLERKRDIGMGHKRSNDGYASGGPNASFSKSGCGAVLTVFWSPEVG